MNLRTKLLLWIALPMIIVGLLLVVGSRVNISKLFPEKPKEVVSRAELLQPATAYQLLKGKFTVVDDIHLAIGDELGVLNSPPRSINGEELICCMLPNEHGDFVAGREMWLPKKKLRFNREGFYTVSIPLNGTSANRLVHPNESIRQAQQVIANQLGVPIKSIDQNQGSVTSMSEAFNRRAEADMKLYSSAIELGYPPPVTSSDQVLWSPEITAVHSVQYHGVEFRNMVITTDPLDQMYDLGTPAAVLRMITPPAGVKFGRTTSGVGSGTDIAKALGGPTTSTVNLAGKVPLTSSTLPSASRPPLRLPEVTRPTR